MYREELRRLGLTEKEALVYLTLLRLGPSVASTLARTTSIKRTSIYDILNSLIEKNLISSFKQSNYTYFIVDDVNKLYLQEKQKVDLAKTLVEKLKNKENLDAGIQVNYYKGKEGYREIFHDILKVKPKEVLAWLHLEKFHDGLGDKNEREWRDERIKKKIYGRLIVQNTKAANELKKTDNAEYRETRIIKKFPFETSCHLYDDHVIFHDTTEDIIAIRIQSPAIYQMMKQIFEMSWQGLVGQ